MECRLAFRTTSTPTQSLHDVLTRDLSHAEKATYEKLRASDGLKAAVDALRKAKR